MDDHELEQAPGNEAVKLFVEIQAARELYGAVRLAMGLVPVSKDSAGANQDTRTDDTFLMIIRRRSAAELLNTLAVAIDLPLVTAIEEADTEDVVLLVVGKSPASLLLNALTLSLGAVSPQDDGEQRTADDVVAIAVSKVTAIDLLNALVINTGSVPEGKGGKGGLEGDNNLDLPGGGAGDELPPDSLSPGDAYELENLKKEFEALKKESSRVREDGSMKEALLRYKKGASPLKKGSPHVKKDGPVKKGSPRKGTLNDVLNPRAPKRSRARVPPDGPYSPPSPPAAPHHSAEPADEVDCTAYAPGEASPGNSFLVQVFAHLPEQAASLEAIAKEADPNAKRRAARTLDQSIKRGTRLTFNITMPHLEVDEPSQSLIWRGKPASVQFAVTVPKDSEPRDITCTVVVAENTIPIGHLKFILKVVKGGAVAVSDTPAVVGNLLPYKQAFISYASADRAEVLKRVQILNASKVKYFQDLLTLEPGDKWEKLIYQYIDESDVFYLFWSKAASKSRWVKKEIAYAQKRKAEKGEAPPEIVPILIEGPPPAKPPKALSFLHFNDKFLYFIQVEEALSDG